MTRRPSDDVSSTRPTYVAPEGPIEEGLAAIWEEVLGVADIGVDDDFFALGGHSLHVARVGARIDDLFAVEVPLGRIFEAPKLSELAAAVVAALEGELDEAPAPAHVGEVVVPPSTVPASFAQESLWFIDQLDPGTSNYNVPLVEWLRGPLDVRAMTQAFDRVLARHDVLRATFDTVGDAVVQRYADPPSQALRVEDATGWSEGALQSRVREETSSPFDLRAGPLTRAWLFARGPAEHLLVVTMHHAVTDGASITLFWRELMALYAAFATGAPDPLPPLASQYGDYALWQRSQLSGARWEHGIAYWKTTLLDAPHVLQLAADRPRPRVPTFRGDVVTVTIHAATAGALTSLGRQLGATPFMVLLAGYAAVLSRYGTTQDLLVGSPVAGRVRVQDELLIGLFVNTLPLRVRLEGKPSFSELVTRVRTTCLRAFDEQSIPFEAIVAAVNPPRDPSRNPLVQALFSLAQPVDSTTKAATIERVRADTSSSQSKFDLSLTVRPMPDGTIFAAFEYSTDLFDEATARRIADSFVVLLDAAAAAPQAPITSLPLMASTERQRVLVDFNATDLVLPVERTVHALIEAQAARTPDAIAVELEDVRLSYRELDARANSVAAWLSARGVGRGSRVAVELERSVDMVASVLGVLKAGAAYVPIDPSYPDARRALMRHDAAVAGELTDATLLDALATDGTARTPVPLGSDDLAYVLYTSGSTGRPKGVMVPHGSLVSFLATMQRSPGLQPSDTLLSVTTLSFDIAGLELYLPLTVGAKVVVASRETASDPMALAALLEKTGATVMQATPATWGMLLASGWRPARRLRMFCGGEAMGQDLAAALAKDGGGLWNLYGPTETTIWSTCSQVDPGEHVTIGRPIGNTRVYIVDDELQLLPIGVPGELCIAGAGVVRGYLDRPGLTAAQFVPDPFATRPGARMYRTGDLARWSSSGHLECLGRSDNQVKVRGFRIELGEIEASLAAADGVTAAAVVVSESAPGDKRLVGYVVGEMGKPLDITALRSALRLTLPEYMLPTAFVTLDALPLTPNGKVDRKSLPPPDATALLTEEYVAPRTATEEALAGIWQEVLGAPRVGVHDDFFALGGHSLLATRVISRLRVSRAVDVPLRALFEAPTLAAFARRVDAARADESGAIERVTRDRLLEASWAQERFWFLEQLDPGKSTYHLGVVLRVRGALDVEALRRAVAELARRHEALRTTFGAPGGALEQVIHTSIDFELELVDAPDSASARHSALAALGRSFDLERGPLARAALVRLAEDEHVFVFAAHHIVSDAWSIGVFSRELEVLYEAFRNGQRSPLEELPLQYADFAAWQRKWLLGGEGKRQLAYWKGQLSGAPAELELPSDRVRPPVKGSRGGTVTFRLSQSVTARVTELARAEGATRYMVLLAAFHVLLTRLTSQKDTVVGAAVANRGRAELEGIFGCFANTVALRTRVDGAPSFRDVLRRTKKAVLGALEHQDVPFGGVVEMLQPTRDPSRTPVYQVMFGLQEGVGRPVTLADVEVSAESGEGTASLVDLWLMIAERGDELSGAMQYDADLFDHETVKRFAEHYEILLTCAAAAPERCVDALPLMTDAERHRVLTNWAEPAADATDARTLGEVFEEQASKTPDAVAVCSDERSFTYRDLSIASSRVAAHVRRSGAVPGAVVGVYVERAPERLVAMLGVLKAGCAYLGIDPELPSAHVSAIVERMSPSLVLTRRQDRRRLPRDQPVLEIEACALDAGDPVDSWRPGPSAADGPACVAYRPRVGGFVRGLVVTHRLITNVVACVGRAIATTSSDVFLDASAASSSTALSDPFSAWAVGGRVVVLPAEAQGDSRWMIETAKSEGVTVLGTTARLLGRLVEQRSLSSARKLRAVCAHGDVPGSTADKFFALHPGRLVGLHGPSEAFAVTFREYARSTAPDAPLERGDIGRALAGTQLYVLDEHLEPVPVNVPGTLFVGGEHYAIVYVNDPALTARRFVADTFSGRRGGRLFATATSVRRLPDGSLVRVGREPSVEIGDYVVDIAEVEEMLRRDDRVADAAVSVRRADGGEPRLVVHVVRDAAAEAGGATIERLLQEVLPDLPSELVMLDDLPRTADGAIDRDTLLAGGRRRVSAAQYVAPRTPIEEALADIWQKVLGVARVGVHDDFFDLGGHSLLVMQIVGRLREALDRDVPVRILFEAPTIAALAQRVSAQSGALLRPALERTTTASGEMTSYCQDVFLAFERDRPSSGTWTQPLRLRLRGPLQVKALREAIGQLVARQESLRLSVDFRSDDARVDLCSPEDFPLNVVDMKGLGEDIVSAFCYERACDAFDRAPLVRFHLLELGAEDHVLMITWHQLVHDATATDILATELAEQYAARLEKREPRVAPLTARYVDYAVWEKGWYEHGAGQAEVDDARSRLQDAHPLELPTDRPRKGAVSPQCVTTMFRLEEAASKHFFGLCEATSATPFMGFCVVASVFLARWSGQNDITFMAPVNLRALLPEMQHVLGRFWNATAITVSVAGDPTLAELFRRARAATLSAYAHASVPVALVFDTPLVYDHPLLRVLLNTPEVSAAPRADGGAREVVPGLLATPEHVPLRSGARNDVAIILGGSETGLYGGVRGATDLFDAETIKKKAAELASVMRALDLELRVSELRVKA